MTIKPLLVKWMPNVFNSSRGSEDNELSNPRSWKARVGLKKGLNPWSISAATNVSAGSEENILEDGHGGERHSLQQGDSQQEHKTTKVWIKSTYSVHSSENV